MNKKIIIIISIVVAISIVVIIGLVFLITNLAKSEKEAVVDDNIDTIKSWNENNQAEAEVFNATFKPYMGDSVSGSQINMLIEKVRNTNETMEGKEVRIKANISRWDYDSNKADIESYYKVSCEYDDNGYINTILLEDAEN